VIPTSGMQGLLKSMGFDPDAMKGQLEAFIANMQAAAAAISANQARLEAQGARIEAQGAAILGRLDLLAPAPRTVEVLEDGKPTGVLITDEKFPQAMIDDVFKSPPGGAEHGDATT
jgi:hypothetical protein